MKTLIFEAHDEADTARLAAALATALPSRAVVGLCGTLGAGKTRFVQCVAELVGVERRDVSSPTFVLVHEYAGRVPIFHFDTYRLRDEAEFIDLGAHEYFERPGWCFVEWADRVASILPDDRLDIEIQVTGETSRTFVLASRGSESAAALERTAAALGAAKE